MERIQIVRYVSNWKYLIALCTVLGGIFMVISVAAGIHCLRNHFYTNTDAKAKDPVRTDIDNKRNTPPMWWRMQLKN